MVFTAICFDLYKVIFRIFYDVLRFGIVLRSYMAAVAVCGVYRIVLPAC